MAYYCWTFQRYSPSSNGVEKGHELKSCQTIFNGSKASNMAAQIRLQS